MERLTLPPGGAEAIDEYLEYRRIVGEDDGGKLFTPEEFEEYKRKVLPMRVQNRLYVSWRSPTGMDCKLVGPETLCFCTHRYKQHKTDFETMPQQRPISLPCQVTGCQCRAYLYVPLNGTQPIRCRCKHFAEQHSAASDLICTACELPESTSSQVSSLRKPEEDDMAFFERRYQERIKMERAAKQKGKAPLSSTTKPS
ncbi:PREDICTED: protein FAM221A [Chrysochloris asiatica]|uniref:Protein FAM221A n=1 Tax=Chrysochloris asiatica TaxID=185453 RepID=A0A9B0T024_CHRAS|nr:PREDICTED: protein FAM221A [Chrysochloris asiatica]